MSSQDDTVPLGSMSICVAVDKSGSTYGRTLDIELGVVQEICGLRESTNIKPVSLLPWCDEASRPIYLPEQVLKMRRLVGSGGTNPSALFQQPACLKALQECGMWFLLTDGQIHDSLVKRFAVGTSELGLHNKPCVIIVFDDMSSGRPSTCNISVGIAAYAVVPDCLFLFHDRASSQVKIMQAKGKFKALLSVGDEKYEQPVISKYTTWAELPRTSYENLSQIRLSPTKILGKDEIQLQNGLVVKLADVLAGKVDAGTVEKIVNDDDNLKSIVLASMTRGSGKDLENWLQTQQKPVHDVSKDRTDINGRAQAALNQLLQALKNNAPAAEIDTLRSMLRAAHEGNWQLFKKGRLTENANRRQHRMHNQRMRNGMGIVFQKQQTVNSWSNNMYCVDMNSADEQNAFLERKYDDSNTIDPVFLPGFQRRAPVDEYVGRCMLCHRTGLLAMLLKASTNATTANFPQIGSHTKVAFPLEMGNYAEMDVLSFYVSCESCAYYLTRHGTCPNKDIITSALGLVCLKDNQPLWLEALDTAVKGRFDRADLLSIFIAILDRKIVENNARFADPEEKQLFAQCAQYTMRKLVQIAEISSTLSPSLGKGQANGPKEKLSAVLSKPNFANPGVPENTDLLLLRYPIAGFMVLLRVLQARGLAQQQVQTLLFQRLLYSVIESYFARRVNGASELLVEEILGYDANSMDSSPGPSVNSINLKIPVERLIAHSLLSAEYLLHMRSMTEFGDVEGGCGPAMAVFLHHLRRYGGVYTLPETCFNAIKVGGSMRQAILNPLGIGPGLSADLIAQM